MARLLSERDEYALALDDNNFAVAASSIAPLFFGRSPTSGSKIEIGSAPGPASDKLTIKIVDRAESLPQELKASWRQSHDTGTNLTCTTFREMILYSIWHGQRIVDHNMQRQRYLEESLYGQFFEDYGVFGLGGSGSGPTDSKEPATVPCVALGPELLSSSTIAKYWENVALTDDEDRATRALSIAIGENVERLASVHEWDNFGSPGPLVIARLNRFNTRVPLKSLGNDAMRLFSVALALSRSKNGLVVIDEVESGIHHTAHDNL